MRDVPFTFQLPSEGGIPSVWDNHIIRKLSSMQGQYLDQTSYQTMLSQEDTLLYEVYEINRPQVAGELLQGISIIHPGKVGDEYFMTKGHFHKVLETGEIYYCLSGEGVMVMETPEGDWNIQEFRPGHVLYVLPRWAHRSVNTSLSEDLIFFFAYPGNAGHDYGTIEEQGFRKLVVERGGKREYIDNPRWKAPQRSRS
jgi:glucose-6-phosphate isomerase